MLNEFERGVATGLLLTKPAPKIIIMPVDPRVGMWYETPQYSRGPKISTKVELRDTWYWEYYDLWCDDYYVMQTYTYTDGTSDTWEAKLSRNIMGTQTLVQGEFSGWVFDTPNNVGNIEKINWTYTNGDGQTEMNQYLNWKIPQTEATKQ